MRRRALSSALGLLAVGSFFAMLYLNPTTTPLARDLPWLAGGFLLVVGAVALETGDKRRHSR